MFPVFEGSVFRSQLFFFIFPFPNFSKNIGTSAKDNRQATAILDRNSAIDNSEVDNLKKNKLRYLLGALENYCSALKLGTRHDLKTFRLISLW